MHLELVTHVLLRVTFVWLQGTFPIPVAISGFLRGGFFLRKKPLEDIGFGLHLSE